MDFWELIVSSFPEFLLHLGSSASICGLIFLLAELIGISGLGFGISF